MAEPPRTSLFTQVTGAFRRRPAGPALAEAPQAPRQEPVLHQESRPEQPRASVRQTVGEEVAALEIPAFLRRQSS